MNESILIATRDWETMKHFDKLGHKVLAYSGSYLINDDKFNYAEIINNEIEDDLSDYSVIIFTYSKELKLLIMEYDNDILIYNDFEVVSIRLTEEVKNIFIHLKANNISLEAAIQENKYEINNIIKWIKK